MNSVVPAVCEMWRRHGLNPSRIAGISGLDAIRANKFVHELTGRDPSNISIPVIGGNTDQSLLPLFSQSEVASTIPPEQIPALDKRVQGAGSIITAAHKGKRHATLSL